MKKHLIMLFTGFIIFGTIGAAQATVILTDDSIFGADSIIRDLDNGRDFLRLDFTTPYTYNQVISEFDAGGYFAGWSVASIADMELFGQSAGLVQGSTDVTMLAEAEMIRDWFGAVNLSSTHEYSRGLVSDFFYPSTYEGVVAQYAFSIGRRFNVDPNEVDFRVSGYGGRDHENEEIFLIRNSTVPEPASVLLMLSGLAALTGSRIRRHK